MIFPLLIINFLPLLPFSHTRDRESANKRVSRPYSRVREVNLLKLGTSMLCRSGTFLSSAAGVWAWSSARAERSVQRDAAVEAHSATAAADIQSGSKATGACTGYRGSLPSVAQKKLHDTPIPLVQARFCLPHA
jgi:hypothetical protein